MNTKSNGVDARMLERLTSVVATYGADQTRWPPEERDALQSLIVRMGSAAGRFREESALDELLDRATPPQPPEGAVDRVLAHAELARSGGGRTADVLPFQPRMAAPPSSPIAWRPTAGVVAASLLLGVVAGNLKVTDGYYLRGVTDIQIEDIEPDQDLFAVNIAEPVPDEDEP